MIVLMVVKNVSKYGEGNDYDNGDNHQYRQQNAANTTCQLARAPLQISNEQTCISISYTCMHTYMNNNVLITLQRKEKEKKEKYVHVDHKHKDVQYII